MYPQRVWPIFVNDKEGRRIYLTKERWEHALGHPGMNNSLLPYVVNTLQLGICSQDRYDPNKYKYGREYSDLPMLYTHMIVVVKFGWKGIPAQANNFILTAYMVEKW
ncbi:MAG: hypothetical protein U0175_00015 [Caldilineaceae bacterium]